MIVEELQPSAHAEWDAYVETHPAGNCYHLRAWAEVASRAYGHRAPYLVARETAGGPMRGGLPLFLVANPFGRYLTSAMFGGYGAILVDGEEARQALLDAAVELARSVRASRLQLKVINEVSCPSGFFRHDLGEVATLSLQGSAEELWRRLHDNARRAVRKGQKSGFELRLGTEQLPQFYEVLARNYHRLGTPIYGFAVMRELVAALPGRIEIATLWKDGEAIGGALVLDHKSTTYVPFVSSTAELFKLGPSHLLYWEIMQRARERGMQLFDFGRSPVGSGPAGFKLRWGATMTPQPHFVFSRDGKPPRALSADNPWERRAIAIWQRLPRPIADRLGPWLHGHFFV
jgi:FemAB-related protein (PEP-CTERM system-associated)